MAWLAPIIAQVIQALIAWVVSLGMKWAQKKKLQVADDEQIDAKLARYKDAYKAAHDGTPMTPEQVKELRDAFRELVRGS